MKRIAIVLLQLLVTSAGVWYVFHDPERRSQIANALRHADKSWLIVAWVCYGAVEALATVRWQFLLRVQRISLSWWRTGGIVMIGLFFNMFLPGLIGGDVMRLYFVFKKAPRQKTRSTLSVAMDRFFGLLSILFLATFGLAFRFKWLERSPETLHIACLALALLGSAFVFVVFLFGAIGFGLLDRLPSWVPLRNAIIQCGQAVELYRKHFAITVFAFVITIASHLVYYVSFYCAGRALLSSATLLDMLSIMPLVNTVTSLPISFGGLGVRETLFQQLLGNLAHVTPAIAVLTASLGFAIQASWGLLGAGIYLLAKKLGDR